MPPIALGLRGSWRPGAALRRMCGEGGSGCLPPPAWAPTRTGKSKPCLWRWQERFMHEGVDGLLRDRTRPSRVAPLPLAVAERVVALTPDRCAGRDNPLD